jgi:sugar phosphate isomerase/epimerase
VDSRSFLPVARREFLRQSGLGLMGSAAFLASRQVAYAYPLDGVMGVQSADIRQQLQSDLDGTLKTLAGWGYRALDLVVPTGPGQPARYRESLNAAGIICHNAHFPAAMFEDDRWSEALEIARTLGVKEMVCAGGIRAATADDWKKYADLLNRNGARTNKEGLQLGWHNHGEFKPIDGQVPFDILLNNTDPALVKFQIDVGNMAQAGGDPVAYLKNYPTRYYSMHVKEVKDGRIGFAVGEGTQDFPTLFKLAKAANIHNFDVETGAPAAEVMDKVKLSADFLKGFPLV